jgi:hypothetical protein
MKNQTDPLPGRVVVCAGTGSNLLSPNRARLRPFWEASDEVPTGESAFRDGDRGDGHLSTSEKAWP